MRFGSVCSGIEAASVAFNPLGWQAAWFSEIDPFPCELLKQRFPEIPNLGDMTKLPELIRTGAVEAPDFFCGGTPCQAFSVAGLRKSLDDHRGNLSLIFCEIANEIETVRLVRHLTPPIILWENVPGVLSTKDNAFGCFVAGLCGSDVPLTVQNGKWPNAGIVAGPKRKIAWRTLNAKYFGVPQQRKRIFVVASSRDDIDPAKILFELPRMCGATDQSDSERQDITAFSESSFGTFRKSRSATPVRAAGGTGGGGSETIIIDISHADDVIRESKNLVPTLKARMGTGGNNVPCLMDQGGSIMTVHNNMTGTLRAESHGHEPIIEHRSETTSTICIAENTIGRKAENGGNGIGSKINTSFTLNATGVHGVCDRSSLRRLTPLECERLQGFPDNWTKIAYKGKTVENCPDSPRYKAIGNSWAVPVVRWIGQRIQDALTGKHDEK